MFYQVGDTVKWRYPTPNTSEAASLGFVISVSIGRCTVFWYDTGKSFSIDNQSIVLAG